MLVPEVQKIPLSSGEVAVRTAGDASKPALVLLHGFPSSSRTFRDVIAPLSGSVHVVAPDLPGFGASDLPPEPSFDMLASSIEELLSRLGVGRRFLYVHDFGAPVAFHLAMRNPELAEGLIIQNAMPIAPALVRNGRRHWTSGLHRMPGTNRPQPPI
jgi:pimeloyl-ACP methyl ester carboxylesterase